MSVELHEEAGGKILILTLSGKIMKEDYALFTPEVDRSVKQYGKVRMLVRLNDFHGWTLGAVWEDVNFDLFHFTHIDRLALVGDKAAGRLEWRCVYGKPFTTAKVQYFDVSKADEAGTWIHEGIAQTSQAM